VKQRRDPHRFCEVLAESEFTADSHRVFRHQLRMPFCQRVTGINAGYQHLDNGIQLPLPGFQMLGVPNTDSNKMRNPHQKAHITLNQQPLGPYIIHRQDTDAFGIGYDRAADKGFGAHLPGKPQASLGEGILNFVYIIYQKGFLLPERYDKNAF